jgi:putative transposase
MVFPPDHLHTLWELPPGDADYPSRWSSIKSRFSRGWLARGGGECEVTPSGRRQGRRGIWQPRYLEHTIRDEGELNNHADYIHYNPVKHGLAACPKDWPWSTFLRHVARGQYPLE